MYSHCIVDRQGEPSCSQGPQNVMENKEFVNSSSKVTDDRENGWPSGKGCRTKSGVRIHITAEDLFARDNADIKASHQNEKSFLSTICSRFHPVKLMPVLEWLPRYQLSYFKDDLVAAIIVLIMHVPQGLAYGELAGVSAVQGLYVSTFPPLIYALLGTTRHISIGTFAVVALLVRSATSEISDTLIYDQFDNQTYVSDLFTRGQVATTLSAVVGILQIIMGLLALGSLSVFFSEPMLSGFVTGAAMHVISAQLRDLLDIKVSRRKGAFKALLSLYDIVAHITELNWMTALFGISAMLFIYQGQLLNERFKAKLFMPLPMELVTVVVATILSYFIGLQEKYGSSIMGHIPTGVPRVSLPEVSLFPLMIKDALIIAFISYVIALSLGKTFGRRNRYNVDANQELVAMGGANVFGSFIDCFPCAASLSRSSVQEKAGGKTQLTTIFSSMFLFFTILFAGPLFFYLPKCVLSSIIIVALKDMLFQVYDCIRCSKISFIESGVWLSTFLAVFIIDLEYGIVAGPLTTVVALLYRDSRPRVRFVSSMFCEGLFIESMGWIQRYLNARLHIRNTNHLVTNVAIDKTLELIVRGVHCHSNCQPQLRETLEMT
ncbi:solute carrier family 26 member 6-like isoform X3 [Varroa destructor]|uniref:SLC26A/SulP transporter domain-containing protein n=2 Tax=Varroa TaxID=62624 RepID=A0A7M7MEM3_VARDE|nr:solute carrier family 26 member 6-like isoform X3 [Varroa destructor]